MALAHSLLSKGLTRNISRASRLKHMHCTASNAVFCKLVAYILLHCGVVPYCLWT